MSQMGWIVGFEPTVSSATNWRFNQLSYTHHMARQKGLEPLTYCLEGSCSIQLSYWRISCATLWRCQLVYYTSPIWICQYFFEKILIIYGKQRDNSIPGIFKLFREFCAVFNLVLQKERRDIRRCPGQDFFLFYLYYL